MITANIMRWCFHAGAIAGDGATCGLIVPCHLSQLIGDDGTASGGDKTASVGGVAYIPTA